MNELKRRIEIEFDPSDTDNANTLAYRALYLLRVCERVLFANNAGMRVGRDDGIELAVRMRDVAETLGLLPYQASGVESKAFHVALAKEAGLG